MSSLGDYILSFCSQSKDAEAYARTHLTRLVRTLEITPPGAPGDRILEMGAYMQITPALRTKLGYGEVRGSYLGPAGQVDEKTVRSTEGEQFGCLIDLFDAEEDGFPYPDGHFATVLCCELLEHLSHDPMRMMTEINRVLRVDGHLVLTTPNICSLHGVAATLTGYHPGMYQHYIRSLGGDEADPRHSREYAPREITDLFEAAGFAKVLLETGPYGEASHDHDWVLGILEQHGLPTELRGEVIYAVGRKTGPVKERYPAWLYD